MSSLGRAIREPHRRIHWAGVETDMSKEPFVPANDGVSLGVGSFRLLTLTSEMRWDLPSVQSFEIGKISTPLTRSPICTGASPEVVAVA